MKKYKINGEFTIDNLFICLFCVFYITCKPQTLESQSTSPKMRIFTYFFLRKKTQSSLLRLRIRARSSGPKKLNLPLLYVIHKKTQI